MEVLAAVALAKRKAEQGVDYSPRFGAVCPECGKVKLKAYKTMPWKSGMRYRYHRCDNPACLVCALGVTVKSVEMDQSGVRPGMEATSA